MKMNEHKLPQISVVVSIAVVMAVNALAASLLYLLDRSGWDHGPLLWMPNMLTTAAGIGIAVSLRRGRSVAYAPLPIRGSGGSASKHTETTRSENTSSVSKGSNICRE
jgi:hypothetical protein